MHDETYDDLPESLRHFAAAQAGIVSRTQMLEHGLTPYIIRSSVKAGRWKRIHPRTYALFTGPLPRQSALWAGLVYAGDGATLSHHTAAAEWGLDEARAGAVHVTIPVLRRVPSLATVRIHYAHRLATSRHPSKTPPVTTVEDTVLDLIDRAQHRNEVLMWLTRACQRGLTTPERLGLSLESRKKISWRDEAESILADVTEGAETSHEIAYFRDVEQAHGLPHGRRQRHRRVAGRSQYSDVEYEEFQTIVELDGRLGHVEEGAFRDHRRDNAAALQGRTTLRYGRPDVSERSCVVAMEVATVLQANGWTGRPTACSPGCYVALVA